MKEIIYTPIIVHKMLILKKISFRTPNTCLEGGIITRTAILFIGLCISVFWLSGCAPKPEINLKVSEKEPTSTIEAEVGLTRTQIPTRTMQPTNSPSTTFTIQPTETSTQAVSTQTQTPTSTSTSTPGPFFYADDFSTYNENWVLCNVCRWRGGRLHIGPYTETDAYKQIVVFCWECGMTLHHRVSVEVSFYDGQSDRGYGIVINANDEALWVLEITPWQTLVVWKYDYRFHTWELIRGEIINFVNAGKDTNHLEVILIQASIEDRTDVFINVNGRTAFILYNQEIFPGAVGLTLFGHAIEVAFDNFEFETLEKPEAFK